VRVFTALIAAAIGVDATLIRVVWIDGGVVVRGITRIVGLVHIRTCRVVGTGWNA
jgi:hypothetical protein